MCCVFFRSKFKNIQSDRSEVSKVFGFWTSTVKNVAVMMSYVVVYVVYVVYVVLLLLVCFVVSLFRFVWGLLGFRCVSLLFICGCVVCVIFVGCLGVVGVWVFGLFVSLIVSCFVGSLHDIHRYMKQQRHPTPIQNIYSFECCGIKYSKILQKSPERLQITKKYSKKKQKELTP